MANITVQTSQDFNMFDANIGNLYYGYDYNFGSSRLTIYWDSSYQYYDQFTGTGFKYNNYGEPTSGTVTGYKYYYYGTVVEVSGYSMSAVTLANYAANSDTVGAYEDLLSKANTFNGNSGSDYFYSYAGNDTLYGNAGNDYLYGGSGNDLLDGGPGFDSLYGGAGNDTYIVDGFDTVFEDSNQGFDTIKSGIFWTLDFNFEKLILTGSASGGYGNNLNNIIVGNSAANTLSGLGGNDTLSGNNGNDILLGGSGRDTLRGGRDDDTLNGGADRDKLLAGTGNDILIGEGGYDRLHGGSGHDKLYGGTGNDYLVATFGGDTLTGGTGADKFRFYKPVHGNDKITDFNRAEGDTIQVSSRNFARLSKGTLSKYRFASNSSGVALDSNDYFVFNTTNKVLYFDADGSGSGSAVQIARMTNGVNLLNTDIVVV